MSGGRARGRRVGQRGGGGAAGCAGTRPVTSPDLCRQLIAPLGLSLTSAAHAHAALLIIILTLVLPCRGRETVRGAHNNVCAGTTHGSRGLLLG